MSLPDELKKFLDKVTVLDHEEYLRQLTSGGLLVCMRVNDGGSDCFPDNERSECGVCGEPIYFRPYNAVAVNKVCMRCALLLGQAGEV
jgi:hypothetical protein